MGGGVETAAALAGGAAVTLGAWVWATGELGGALASGRWPRVPARAVAGIVVRLPQHFGDPAAAWPSAVRAQLPGRWALAALAVAVAGAALVGGWAALRVLRPRLWACRGSSPRQVGHPSRRSRVPRPASHRRAAGARWATWRDSSSLRVRGAPPGRLVVGLVGHSRVATEARHSVLVVGPTQSGKTTGLAIPAILEWPGPVVATSVKDDLAATTLAWRSRLGYCWVFDPTATSGLLGATGWSPLAEAGTWSGAQRVAGWMVEATPARSGLSDAAFWYAAAAKQLAPLLLAARLHGGTMAAVVRWNNLAEFDEPLAALDAAGEVDASVALAACVARDDRIRSSVGTTLETVLGPFEDPVVAGATASCDIDTGGLLSGPNALYLCGPSYEQQRVQGLFASLVSAVVAEAVARVNRSGRPLDPPLLVVLDEAANIAPIRDLDMLASIGAGMGIQLVTVVQDLAELAARYTPERAQTIANNHRAKVVLSGVADLSTLDLLSGLVGDAIVREETVTHDLRDGRRTRSTATALRRLAPTDELRRIDPGTGVLVYGHLPPARIRLRPWYRDRSLRAKATADRRPPPR